MKSSGPAENLTLTQTGRVMIVDDHRQARESMADVLRAAGHEVLCCSSAPEALQVLEQENVDCIVTDLKMPGMNGVELIVHLEKQRLGMPRWPLRSRPCATGHSITSKNPSTSINWKGS
jgi:CheY-like chemotaxis protein